MTCPLEERIRIHDKQMSFRIEDGEKLSKWCISEWQHYNKFSYKIFHLSRNSRGTSWTECKLINRIEDHSFWFVGEQSTSCDKLDCVPEFPNWLHYLKFQLLKLIKIMEMTCESVMTFLYHRKETTAWIFTPSTRHSRLFA